MSGGVYSFTLEATSSLHSAVGSEWGQGLRSDGIAHWVSTKQLSLIHI